MKQRIALLGGLHAATSKWPPSTTAIGRDNGQERTYSCSPTHTENLQPRRTSTKASAMPYNPQSTSHNRIAAVLTMCSMGALVSACGSARPASLATSNPAGVTKKITPSQRAGTPAAKHPGYIAPQHRNQPITAFGIVHDHQPTFSAPMSAFYQADEWAGPSAGGGGVGVSAGAPRLCKGGVPSTKGELEVGRTNSKGKLRVSYVTYPSIKGPFDITNAKGDLLTITGHGGASFTYNVGTGITSGSGGSATRVNPYPPTAGCLP